MTEGEYCPKRVTKYGEGFNINCVNCKRKDIEVCKIYQLVKDGLDIVRDVSDIKLDEALSDKPIRGIAGF